MEAEITIEPIALRHAGDVQRLASHPEVVATTNLPDPYPEDGARAWIEALLPRQEAGEEYAFAILQGNEELVGTVGLVEVKGQEAELGYWIGKPYWNQGHATAAARQVLDVAFDELGLERVFARPLERNWPSRRVLEKLGFTFRRLEAHEHPKWDSSDRFARYELAREVLKEMRDSVLLLH